MTLDQSARTADNGRVRAKFWLRCQTRNVERCGEACFDGLVWLIAMARTPKLSSDTSQPIKAGFFVSGRDVCGTKTAAILRRQTSTGLDTGLVHLLQGGQINRSCGHVGFYGLFAWIAERPLIRVLVDTAAKEVTALAIGVPTCQKTSVAY